jgi:hypothetical protein
VASPEAFWRTFHNSAVEVLAYGTDSWARRLHAEYLTRNPGAQAQPVIYRDPYGGQYREGFFRDRQSMLAVNQITQRAWRMDPTGEGGAVFGIQACVSQFLADNARN